MRRANRFLRILFTSHLLQYSHPLAFEILRKAGIEIGGK